LISLGFNPQWGVWAVGGQSDPTYRTDPTDPTDPSRRAALPKPYCRDFRHPLAWASSSVQNHRSPASGSMVTSS
jgi:hypothetical protein